MAIVVLSTFRDHLIESTKINQLKGCVNGNWKMDGKANKNYLVVKRYLIRQLIC